MGVSSSTDNTPSQPTSKGNYTSFLQSFEQTPFFSSMLNIVLVKLGVRKATLIELNDASIKANLAKGSTKGKLFDSVIHQFQLVKTPDFVPYRFFVTQKPIQKPQTESEIGELLGFECKEHNFSNQNIDRICYKIVETQTNAEIYAEMCETWKIENEERLREIQNKKVKLWNQTMNQNQLPYRFSLKIVRISPITTLLNRKNYRNKQYVLEHLNEYKDLLDNEFRDGSKVLPSKNWIQFLFIMDKLSDITHLYEKPENEYPGEGFDHLLRQLAQFESSLLTSTDVTQMNHFFEILLSSLK